MFYLLGTNSENHSIAMERCYSVDYARTAMEIAVQKAEEKHGSVDTKSVGESTAEIRFESGLEMFWEIKDDGAWVTESWFDEDLANALVFRNIPATEQNIAWLRENCIGLFDDKSHRNEMISDQAFVLFEVTKELAIQIADGSFFLIHEDDGYFDWALYAGDYKKICGGQRDIPDDYQGNLAPIWNAANSILEGYGLLFTDNRILNYEEIRTIIEENHRY